jgi:hypothetical protein
MLILEEHILRLYHLFNSGIQYITNKYGSEYKPTIDEADAYNADVHISNSYSNNKFYKETYNNNNGDYYDNGSKLDG